MLSWTAVTTIRIHFKNKAWVPVHTHIHCLCKNKTNSMYVIASCQIMSTICFLLCRNVIGYKWDATLAAGGLRLGMVYVLIRKFQQVFHIFLPVTALVDYHVQKIVCTQEHPQYVSHVSHTARPQQRE